MTQETDRAGTEARPFVEVCSLYLTTGRATPAEAKRDGCVFGFCDARGVQQPKATATHVGWTVEPGNAGGGVDAAT